MFFFLGCVCVCFLFVCFALLFGFFSGVFLVLFCVLFCVCLLLVFHVFHVFVCVYVLARSFVCLVGYFVDVFAFACAWSLTLANHFTNFSKSLH